MIETEYLLNVLKNNLYPLYPSTEFQILLLKLVLIIKQALRSNKQTVDLSTIEKELLNHQPRWNILAEIISDEFVMYDCKHQFPKTYLITEHTISHPRIITEQLRNQRITGCLIGLAVGDALGIRYNLLPAQIAAQAVLKDCDDTSQHLPLLGKSVPGMISEAVQLALVTGENFIGITNVGLYQIAQAWLRWYQTKEYDETTPWFAAIKKDADPQTIVRSIAHSAETCSTPLAAVYALIMVIPLALLNGYPEADVIEFALRVSRLICPQQECTDAIRAFITAARVAQRGADKATIWGAAYDAAQTDTVKNILIASQTRSPSAAQSAVQSAAQSAVLSAFQTAFYELMNGRSFEESLKRVMMSGSHASMNGAISGALLGAWYGTSGTNGIPIDWVNTVLQPKATIRSINTRRIPIIAATLYACKS